MPAYVPGFTHDIFISYAHSNNSIVSKIRGELNDAS